MADHIAYDYEGQRWLRGEDARLELIRQHRFELDSHLDPDIGPRLRAGSGIPEIDRRTIILRLSRELAELGA